MRGRPSLLVSALTLCSSGLLSCGGEEEPYFIARGVGVVADTDSIYYFKNDSRLPRDLIVRAKSSGEQRTLATIPGVSDMAVADGFVVTGSGGALVRIPTAGGPEETITGGSCHDLSTSDGSVFCLSAMPSARVSGEVLVTVPIRGGSLRVVVPENLRAYIVDHGSVFWGARDGRIVRTDVATGDATPLGRAHVPHSMTVDAQDLYFLDVDDTTGETHIHRVARGGGPITIVAQLPFGAKSILVDERYLYAWRGIVVTRRYAPLLVRLGSPTRRTTSVDRKSDPSTTIRVCLTASAGTWPHQGTIPVAS